MKTVDTLASALSDLKYVKFEALAGNFAARLTITRPEALNALNPDVIRDLGTALDALATSECRCLILTGSGEKAFVAGADIKAMTTMKPDAAAVFARAGQDTFRKLEHLPCATIAAVNGFALGGGLELALSCDILLASENAKVGLPEVSLGLLPGFGGTQRLARNVGLNRAREMVFSGNLYTAAQAHDMGLVNHVYPAASLAAEAEKLATTITQRGPLAVRKAKQSILQGWDLDIDAGLKLEASLFAELFTSNDQREGTTAFVEKRSPRFMGN